MQEIKVDNQKEITGGSVYVTSLICVVFSVALYRLFKMKNINVVRLHR